MFLYPFLFSLDICQQKFLMFWWAVKKWMPSCFTWALWNFLLHYHFQFASELCSPLSVEKKKKKDPSYQKYANIYKWIFESKCLVLNSWKLLLFALQIHYSSTCQDSIALNVGWYVVISWFNHNKTSSKLINWVYLHEMQSFSETRRCTSQRLLYQTKILWMLNAVHFLDDKEEERFTSDEN